MTKERLYNRDGGELYLEEFEKNKFIITCDEKHNWVLEYVSISFDGEYGTDDCKLLTFDPSGGPYMEVGSFKLEDGRVLEKIEQSKKNNRTEFIFKDGE